jgi:hypothetical protein
LLYASLHLILLDLIKLMSGEKLKSLISPLFNFLHPPVTFSLCLFLAHIFSLVPCFETSSVRIHPLGRETKFHIHIKHRVKCSKLQVFRKKQFSKYAYIIIEFSDRTPYTYIPNGKYNRNYKLIITQFTGPFFCIISNITNFDGTKSVRHNLKI